MDRLEFYRTLYTSLDAASPLRFDCGRLCSRACCRVAPELPGMYLFPGEEAMFEGKPGYTISEAPLPGWGPVGLLSCDGACERSTRPLSCRVFPLAPKVREGFVAVRLDPRGRAVCPLCRDTKQALSREFAAAVDSAFRALLADPETQEFLLALSRYLDEYEKPL